MSDNVKFDLQSATPENLSEELFLKIPRLIRQYKKYVSYTSDSFGVSPNELSLMMIMYRYPHINTANRIVKELGTTKGLASRSVDSLIKRGLIKAERDRQDKRVVRLTLCSKAKALCADAFRIQRSAYRAAMDGVSEAEVKNALSAAEKMMDSIMRFFDNQ